MGNRQCYSKGGQAGGSVILHHGLILMFALKLFAWYSEVHVVCKNLGADNPEYIVHGEDTTVKFFAFQSAKSKETIKKITPFPSFHPSSGNGYFYYSLNENR